MHAHAYACAFNPLTPPYGSELEENMVFSMRLAEDLPQERLADMLQAMRQKKRLAKVNAMPAACMCGAEFVYV